MAQPQQKRMTADEFLIWHLSQEGKKFELVDGFPVPHRAMAGGSVLHGDIAANVLGNLYAKLRGSPCRPLGSDVAVRTSITQVRYPEVTIDCGASARDRYEAGNPIALFEVFSKTTRKTDEQIKLGEYMRHPTLRTLVFIDPDRMDVVVHSRSADGAWAQAQLTRGDDVIAIAETGVTLSIADVYAGVMFEADSSPVQSPQSPL